MRRVLHIERPRTLLDNRQILRERIGDVSIIALRIDCERLLAFRRHRLDAIRREERRRGRRRRAGADGAVIDNDIQHATFNHRSLERSAFQPQRIANIPVERVRVDSRHARRFHERRILDCENRFLRACAAQIDADTIRKQLRRHRAKHLQCAAPLNRQIAARFTTRANRRITVVKDGACIIFNRHNADGIRRSANQAVSEMAIVLVASNNMQRGRIGENRLTALLELPCRIGERIIGDAKSRPCIAVHRARAITLHLGCTAKDEASVRTTKATNFDGAVLFPVRACGHNELRRTSTVVIARIVATRQ